MSSLRPLRVPAPAAARCSPPTDLLPSRSSPTPPQPYRGLKVPKVAQWHKNVQIIFGTTMWLWLFYRCKEDGPFLFLGIHPWEGHGHGDHDEHGDHGDHGDGHGDEH